MPSVQLIQGDCLEVMATLAENSMDSIICDPPYGLSFMGKAWDHGVPGVPFWEAALRVAKPGAHLLAFGGSRTHHRLMVAIEDAGWEIRDCLMWLYGSGFPKSMDISKAIDKAAGAEREVIGFQPIAYPDSDCWGMPNSGNDGEKTTGNSLYKLGLKNGPINGMKPITSPATDTARIWDGWGTALKPAWEPIILARKPLSEPTVAANVLKWGCGALAIDKCRIGYAENETPESVNKSSGKMGGMFGNGKPTRIETKGRWPANLILSDEAAALLDEMSGVLHTHAGTYKREQKEATNNRTHDFAMQPQKSGKSVSAGNSGGASRFFLRVAADDDEPLRFAYVPKASKRDRDEGLEGMEKRYKLRDDLTPEQREYVTAELQRLGVV